MSIRTHVRWLALHACRPYLRNTLVDSGKEFLLARLANGSAPSNEWAPFGTRSTTISAGATLECRMTTPRERLVYFAGEDLAPSVRLLDHVLDRRFRFVDVGAKSGVATLVAASRAEEVISIEPHPLERGMLERNLAMNDVENVRVLPYALGSRRELSRIIDARAAERPSAPDLSREPGFDVDVLTGDSIIAPSSTHRTWVRIDARGAELPILRGLERLLDSDEVVFQLSIDRAMPEGVSSALEIVSWFRVRGYYPFVVESRALRRMRPLLRRLVKPPKRAGYDLLFTRHQTADAFWRWTQGAVTGGRPPRTSTVVAAEREAA